MTKAFSPIKSVFVNDDGSRMNIELGRQRVAKVNELIPTQRVVSPAKVVIKPSVREV